VTPKIYGGAPGKRLHLGRQRATTSFSARDGALSGNVLPWATSATTYSMAATGDDLATCMRRFGHDVSCTEGSGDRLASFRVAPAKDVLDGGTGPQPTVWVNRFEVAEKKRPPVGFLPRQASPHRPGTSINTQTPTEILFLSHADRERKQTRLQGIRFCPHFSTKFRRKPSTVGGGWPCFPFGLVFD